MKNKKKSEDEVVRTLIETMFLIAGYPDITFEAILKEGDGWWSRYTMSEKQRDDWFKWGSEYIRKELKLTAVNAHRKMQWIDLMWGLRVLKPQQELDE